MAGDFAPVGTERLDLAYFQQSGATTLAYDDIETLWNDIAQQDDWDLFNDKLTQTKAMRQAYGFTPQVADDGTIAIASAAVTSA